MMNNNMMRRSYSSIVSQSRRRWSKNSIVQQAQKRESVSSSFRGSTARSKSAGSPCSTATVSSLLPNQSKTLVKSTLVNSLKHNPLIEQARTALPYIGNGAYLAICSGFLMTDMLQLRLLLVGGYTGLVTFHALHAKPLSIPLRWSAIFVLINAGAAAMLMLDQFGASLTEEEEALFENHFQECLTRGQFYHLLHLAKEESMPPGTVLTSEGRDSPHLYFILEGQAKVYHHKIFAAYVDKGGFVNDVAFQRQQQQKQKQKQTTREAVRGEEPDYHGSYGTVITNDTTKVLVWDIEELQRKLASRPELDRNLKYLLSRHLMKSLLKQREARHEIINRDAVDTERWYSSTSKSTA